MNDFDFKNFLKVASEFKLGNLTTESFHPKTKNLSSLSQENPKQALSVLQEVDRMALDCLKDKVSEIYELHLKIKETIHQGGQIFLCGCGATGRLSLALETFSRQLGEDNVIGFMAGGDYALIKSVESFEDRMSYGHRQLKELGFCQNDLLLAITEGGETSFVIGAAMEAAKISKHNPYFIYCNPDEQLLHLERCSNILNNEKITKLNLNVGAMALSGSTRMQATTVQMLVSGFAMFNNLEKEDFINQFNKTLKLLKNLDYEKLEPFVIEESSIYQNKGYVTYISDQAIAISILTDTTERSPTFNLTAFENMNQQENSLCYLTIQGTDNSKAAWHKLLNRTPRALNWGELDWPVHLNEIYQYDISEQSVRRREKLGLHFPFYIKHTDKSLIFELNNIKQSFDTSDYDFLTTQLALKLLLNAMSTVIMGRLGRYESNIMTWVRPSNYKLIDRASRYIIELLKRDAINIEYEQVAKKVIELSDKINDKNPIVLEVYHFFKQRND